MKLLTWMHRKFKQGSTETLKDFPLGQAFLDDHQVCHKQSHGRQSHRETLARKSFANMETSRLEHLEAAEQKASGDHHHELSQLFEGFLAIGTLGGAPDETPSLSEPETPTFAVSFDKLAEGETEVTENELRLINDELERVLGMETDSSGRNSHVSNGRISHASSTITLSGKPLEICETQNPMVCPLQEYLLGSAVECGDNKGSSMKKEQRMSLGELFERHKAEEISESSKCKKKDDKEGDKMRVVNIMKKLLLKKKIAGSRANHDSDTKLCKLLQKFNKKVHPEYETLIEKSNKMRIKNMIACNGRSAAYRDEYPPDDDHSNTTPALQGGPYMHINKSRRSVTHHSAASNNKEDKGCWIRTDADYLVLEL